MGLTEEQKERIRKNRERALEIQRKRKQAEEEKKKEEDETRRGEEGTRETKRAKRDQEEDGENVELEEFEVNASKFVSAKEAKQMYCLPDGTLDVCAFEEKPNPRHKGWAPMKLYYRAEIRRRARKRFGGLEGLIAERERRAQKRFQKDLEQTRDIFK